MMTEGAKKWIAALRSGEFKQGKDRLRTDDRFCCLGVACELAAREGIIDKGKGERMDSGLTRYQYGSYELYYGEGKYQYLPRLVCDWLGLNTSEGGYNQTSLTVLNDEGATFEEIAAVIESEPEGLFQP